MHNHIKAFLFFLLSVSVIHSPFVFGNKTFQPGMLQPHGVTDGWPLGYSGRHPVNIFDVDMATPAYYEFPLNKTVGDIYKSGALPLWNPYQAAGTPLAADYSTKAFFPYQILEDISPVETWDYFMLGRPLIAAFFTYLFLSINGLSFGAALIGGIFYMFSGIFTWFINLEQLTNVAMVFPLLMCTIEVMARRRSRKDMALLAISSALALLAGQPEVTLYILFAGALYFIYRSASLYRTEPSILPGLAGKAILAFVIGLALASPVILPFMKFVSISHNIHPAGSGVGTAYVPDWKAFFTALAPSTTELPLDPSLQQGILVRSAAGDYYYRALAIVGLWDYLGGYTGALSLFLTIAGLTAVALRDKGQRGMLIFFSAFSFSIILKNFGFRPFLWLGYLPMFDRVWSPRWTSPAWIFTLSVSGALGYEAVFRSRGERPFKTACLIAAVPAVPFIAIFAGTLPEAVGFALNAARLSGLALAPYIVPSMVMGNAAVIIVLLFASAMILYYLKAGKGLYGLIALAALELWWDAPRAYGPGWLYLKAVPFALGLIIAFLFSRKSWTAAAAFIAAFFISFLFIDLRSPYGFPERFDPYKEAPYVKFLKEKGGDYRVIGGYGVLFPDYAGAVGLQDLRYVTALIDKGYRDFRVNYLQAGVPDEELNDSSLWFTGMSQRLTVKADKAGNASYGFAERGIENDIYEKLPYYSLMGVRYILMPSWHSSEMPGTPLIYDKEIKIYENPQVFPRAFVTFSDGGLSDRGLVREASIRRYSANRVEIDAAVERPGTLILSDVPGPGWKATVNGRLTDIIGINGALRGVRLDRGDNKVVFCYMPFEFKAGAILFAAASIAVVITILPRRRVSKD